MTEHPASEPFHEPARQHQADRFGMLVFLASEIMLFGGIFAIGMALRVQHPEGYAAAASRLKLGLGTANTAILLTSSLAAALAVEAARAGRTEWAGRALGAAVALGVLFLAVKGFEYSGEYREGLMPGTAPAHFDTPVERLFMDFYFAATGLHAVHIMIGIALLGTAGMSRAARRDRDAVFIGNAALYWHLVDIVWIFLFPTLYLAGVR